MSIYHLSVNNMVAISICLKWVPVIPIWNTNPTVLDVVMKQIILQTTICFCALSFNSLHHFVLLCKPLNITILTLLSGCLLFLSSIVPVNTATEYTSAYAALTLLFIMLQSTFLLRGKETWWQPSKRCGKQTSIPKWNPKNTLFSSYT